MVTDHHGWLLRLLGRLNFRSHLQSVPALELLFPHLETKKKKGVLLFWFSDAKLEDILET